MGSISESLVSYNHHWLIFAVVVSLLCILISLKLRFVLFVLKAINHTWLVASASSKTIP